MRENIDALYQAAADIQAQQLLAYAPQDITRFPDYGSFTAIINNKEISGGFWHYRLENDVHHVFFKLTRKTLIIMYKTYLSGIKLDKFDSISLLSDTELAEYD
jgi:hypothetical protein